MLVKFIRDYSQNGDAVACVVAIAAGKIGVSYCHPNDRLQKLVVDDGKEKFTFKPFNKLEAIKIAAMRADNGTAIETPHSRITPRNYMGTPCKFKLRQVIDKEIATMERRSYKFFK